MPKFSPSVNLVRDADRELQYIPTANAERIFRQLVDDYTVGIHAFSVIGSYGTGKSAFLLALERTLNGDEHYFAWRNGDPHGAKHVLLPELSGVDFVNLVGHYGSLRDALGQALLVLPHDDAILAAIEKEYVSARQRGHGLAIVIDEFGKFLEYAAQVNPEGELYFIQQLAEWVNHPDRDLMLITVLHQNFSAYAMGLGREQREEWEKVKGRLKELIFSEPVEQLLELAAGFTKNGAHLPTPAQLKRLIDAIHTAAVFPHRRGLTPEFGAKLFPFDILSAAVLTQALQRYGQNERSLFTFLHANDYFGINDYDRDAHPFFNLVCVYDYLAHNYESLLNSVHNPHYMQWGVIRTTQERAEVDVDPARVNVAYKLIKVIGLLNIFAPDGARVNDRFLKDYGEVALGLDPAEVEATLGELETRKLLRHVRFKDSFVLYEGTDLNIELALLEAEGKVDTVVALTRPLEPYFTFPLVLAKATSLRKGTHRFFEFRLSDEPLDAEGIVPLDGFTDGVINLVFGQGVDVDRLHTHVAPRHPAVLYGVYRNVQRIRQTLHEIHKINYLLSINRDDRVGVRELQRLKAEEIEELSRQLLDGLYDPSVVTWIWCGRTLTVPDRRSFNHLLSQVCDVVYTKTPVYRNELVNRHKVSSAVGTARKAFYRALVDGCQAPNLGFDPNTFPPEKSIYLTLLQETGIHRQEEEQFVLGRPAEPSFRLLWDACEEFVVETRHTPKDLAQLTERLRSAPFRLKSGLIDFWVPTFVFAKREAVALYHQGVYTPEVTAETLDLIQKEPHKFRVKSFAVDGVRLEFFNRVRKFVQQDSRTHISNSGFIETIRPFLTFYRSLPPFTQQTTDLDARSVALREVIASATDPEKTFFEDLPQALGFADLAAGEITEQRVAAFVAQLQTSVRALRMRYDVQVDRVERFLLDILGLPNVQFPEYRDLLMARYTALRAEALLPRQRTLLMRLLSPLDDRDAWLNSITQALLNRDIRRMVDGDEQTLFTRMRAALQELDNLGELNELEADLSREAPPVALEITTTQLGSRKLLHRLPRSKERDAAALVTRLRDHLTDDEMINAGALIRLLQELMGDE
ncbi:MAG: ATP-binding protein [Caldilineaceae bacterium]|nr:ATP-binding protein [Caldilineaceae bacterium]